MPKLELGQSSEGPEEATTVQAPVELELPEVPMPEAVVPSAVAEVVGEAHSGRSQEAPPEVVVRMPVEREGALLEEVPHLHPAACDHQELQPPLLELQPDGAEEVGLRMFPEAAAEGHSSVGPSAGVAVGRSFAPESGLQPLLLQGEGEVCTVGSEAASGSFHPARQVAAVELRLGVLQCSSHRLPPMADLEGYTSIREA